MLKKLLNLMIMTQILTFSIEVVNVQDTQETIIAGCPCRDKDKIKKKNPDEQQYKEKVNIA